MYDFYTPLKAVLNVSIYSSLICEVATIGVIIIRVLPHFPRNKAYYGTVFIQTLVDFIQSATVAFSTIKNIHQVKYGGIWMFQVSVMITAFLSVYWTNIKMRSNKLTTILFFIVAVVSIPMVWITGYNTVFKSGTENITTWLLMSGARNFAQISYGIVTLISTFFVYSIKNNISSPATRKLHRKVWIGLMCKTICSVSVALFGINTFCSVILYHNIKAYIADNPWWDSIYFATSCIYSGVNACITFWMLSGLIFRKKKSLILRFL